MIIHEKMPVAEAIGIFIVVDDQVPGDQPEASDTWNDGIFIYTV